MRTLVKITGRSEELFKEHLEGALNLASLFISKGRLPSEDDLESEHISRWWDLREDENKYELYPAGNSYKAFIHEKGENSITLEFFYKYDSKEENGPNFNKTMAELVVVMLGQDNAEIIIK